MTAVRCGALALVILTITACVSSGTTATPGDPVAGLSSYSVACSSCHGPDGIGTEQGPPLVDRIYRPGHHSDDVFLLAVRRGVAQHHWNFGDMPRVDTVSDDDVRNIVAYIRSLQREAGIE